MLRQIIKMQLVKTPASHGTFSDNASYFYRQSQKYPTYQVSLPADIELCKLSSQQTGLNTPIRLYAHLEPFYFQNNLSFNYNNVSLQKQNKILNTYSSKWGI